MAGLKSANPSDFTPVTRSLLSVFTQATCFSYMVQDSSVSLTGRFVSLCGVVECPGKFAQWLLLLPTSPTFLIHPMV
jgi:hypothetical protein